MRDAQQLALLKHLIHERADVVLQNLRPGQVDNLGLDGATLMAGKPGLKISPLAVSFPAIPLIGGVELSALRAGFYKHVRDDLMLDTVRATLRPIGLG